MTFAIEYRKFVGIWLLIIFGVTTDLLIGIRFFLVGSSGLIGIIPRVLTIVVLVIFLTKQKNYFLLFNLFFISYFSLISIANFFFGEHFHLISFEITLKLIVLPLSTGFYFWILEKNLDYFNLILKYLMIAGCILSLGIIVPFTFKFGYPTYFHEGVFGWRGILLSPNDIAACLVIALSIVSFKLFISNQLKYLIQFLIISAGMLILATRASTFGAVLGPLLCFVFLFSGRLLNGKLFQPSRVWVFILLVYVALSPFVIALIFENQYLINKVVRFLSSFSARENQTNVSLEIIFRDFSLIECLFGTGPADFFYEFQSKGKFYSFHSYGKRTEVDWIDVWGGYGIVGLILVYVNMFLSIIFSAIKMFSNLTLTNQLSFIVVLIATMYSIVVGHIVFSPMPIIFVAPFLAKSFVNEKI